MGEVCASPHDRGRLRWHDGQSRKDLHRLPQEIAVTDEMIWGHFPIASRHAVARSLGGPQSPTPAARASGRGHRSRDVRQRSWPRRRSRASTSSRLARCTVARA